MRILLVEDHGDTARVMRRLLAGNGHDVRNAADVASALALACQWEFDLLISDLGLPDRSGLDLIRELRLTHPRVPAIALSGYGTERDIAARSGAGLAEHVTKAVNIDQRAGAIARVVGAGGAPGCG